MADKLVPSEDDTGAIRRFRDMGDGTWAEVVSTTDAAPAAGAAGYPAGATAVHGTSGIVGNTNAVATLAAAGGKTTYITGFQVTGMGATGASGVAVVVTGLIGGQAVYMIGVPAGVTTPIQALIVNFPYPIPASALATAIVVTANAFGAGNVQAAAEAFGFQL